MAGVAGEGVRRGGGILSLVWGLDSDEVRGRVGQVAGARRASPGQGQTQETCPGQWQRGARRGLDHKTSMLLPVVYSPGRVRFLPPLRGSLANLLSFKWSQWSRAAAVRRTAAAIPRGRVD